MFLGGFPRRPDEATAYKKLKTHLNIMGAWIAVIRVTPYILDPLPSALNFAKAFSAAASLGTSNGLIYVLIQLGQIDASEKK
ncbi:mitochondrial import receptor subunit TOM6 [Musa troglodytarum]|uniref:Mitochondrial import receptor subunit TOM6 n=1 Tax=Musa troglodytarum TaxID=320322 RepID=A0A9E7HWY3_9LILI|nr:mitochondrial import receptor subunit TOM6 [Musa troglodytarum]